MSNKIPNTDEFLDEVLGDLVANAASYISGHPIAFNVKKKEAKQAISERIAAERLDERAELRKLFDALGMQIGASAGSATGVIVRNDFGEEFRFQLDRDALYDLLDRFNSKALTPQVSEGEKT
jgi:hypothetical protein